VHTSVCKQALGSWKVSLLSRGMQSEPLGAKWLAHHMQTFVNRAAPPLIVAALRVRASCARVFWFSTLVRKISDLAWG
jgi:hypothetical protein